MEDVPTFITKARSLFLQNMMFMTFLLFIKKKKIAWTFLQIDNK